MKHHTKDKGDQGLGFVIADLLSKGVQVALPISEHLPFDCIGIRDNGTMARIQVRYRTASTGRIRIELVSTWSDRHGVHKKLPAKGSYDILAVYCPNTKGCYYVKAGAIDSSEIVLRIDPPKNNQRLGIRMAEDFIDPTRAWPL